jgi:hypothetical protein
MSDERELIRRGCHEDLESLRGEELPERAFRLLEKILARLDRLETGEFPSTEKVTEPERRASVSGWSNEGVIRALEEGREGNKPRE